ncbi:MAG: BLUF domain-containing protein [Pseudomonadota bacterium]
MNQTPSSLPAPGFYELIYVSTLTDEASINAVPDITRQARVYNPVLGITGLLVFDGDRFCQQIEGPMPAVVELFDRICRDARHTSVSLLHQGSIGERRFRHFNVGYPTLDDGLTLGEIGQLEGLEAVSAFRTLMASVDMGN